MRLPEKLSHFEIVELIGKGGFGEVYKARDTRLDRMVAIKILSAEYSKDPAVRERLQREARAASALNHPNICSVYDIGTAGEENFIVMEFLSGTTLRSHIGKRSLPEPEALQFALQIADALAEAHKNGIIHRDIKTANIFITQRNEVKILDFGLAKMRKSTPAALTGMAASIVPLSNFGKEGPIAVDQDHGASPFGPYGMAGNLKEWCWNASGDKRYILGGAWSEPAYTFADPDAQSPFERQPTYGFRCVKYAGPVPQAALSPVTGARRDYTKEKPVPDPIYEAYKSLYRYDKTPLNARVESSEETAEWKKEKITFDAAYGNERMSVYLFLPRNAKPPYQAVIYFPGSDAIWYRSEFIPEQDWFEVFPFIHESGRALIAPIFKGTFDRADDLKSESPEPTAGYRDHVIQWSKDLGRSIDYLETRNDIDSKKLAYYGYSWGAAMGVIMTAVESRFQASILALGGYYPQKALPEADQINFASHVKVPTLMLNGRYDFAWPASNNQIPMFRLLGTSEKEHKIYETGHSIPRKALIKETLDWLDRYLGPVQQK